MSVKDVEHQSERNMTEYKIHITQYKSNCGGQQKNVKFAKISHLPKWPPTTGIFSLRVWHLYPSNPSHSWQITWTTKNKNINWTPRKVSNMHMFTVDSHVSVYLVAWHGFQLTALAGGTGSMVEHDTKRGWIPWDLPPCYGALALFQPVKNDGISGHGHTKEEIWGGKNNNDTYSYKDKRERHIMFDILIKNAKFYQKTRCLSAHLS